MLGKILYGMLWHFLDASAYAISRPKKPRVAFGFPYLLIELFYIGMPVMHTDRERSELGLGRRG